jgi:alanine-glyoxylate transaminase/serine-glyoxylate transaminase/serine-pyruvate transaminase
MMPAGHDADRFRAAALDTYNISLGSGLSKLAGKAFRIGHLGECNTPTLLGALGVVELALGLTGTPHKPGGVGAALDVFRKAGAN